MPAAKSPLTGIVRTMRSFKLELLPNERLKDVGRTNSDIAPVIVCVVLTGIFRNSVRYKVKAPAVSAITPSKGLPSVSFSTHCLYYFPATGHGSK